MKSRCCREDYTAMYNDVFTPDCDDYETLTTTLELTLFRRLIVVSIDFRMHTGSREAPARFVHTRYQVQSNEAHGRRNSKPRIRPIPEFG